MKQLKFTIMWLVLVIPIILILPCLAYFKAISMQIATILNVIVGFSWGGFVTVVLLNNIEGN